jgi:hypothetical protein
MKRKKCSGKIFLLYYVPSTSDGTINIRKHHKDREIKRSLNSDFTQNEQIATGPNKIK